MVANRKAELAWIDFATNALGWSDPQDNRLHDQREAFMAGYRAGSSQGPGSPVWGNEYGDD